MNLPSAFSYDEEHGKPLFLAGHPAPPGRYIRVDTPARVVIVLGKEDALPPTFDGHIAIYQQVGLYAVTPWGWLDESHLPLSYA